MPDDLSDFSSETLRMRKDVNRNQARPGGDGSHAGAGSQSVVVGEAANASGTRSAAYGWRSWATAAYAVCVGDGEASGEGSVAIGRLSEADGPYSIGIGNTGASGEESVAIGQSAYATALDAVAIGSGTDADGERSVALGPGAQATADDEFVLGAATHSVKVPGDLTVSGTFSNPSARHLKRDIIPAPSLVSIFPELVEYEYIDGDGRRRLGYIADDLVGTDAERFVKFDADGRALAIDVLGLLVAQVAVMHTEIAALKNELRR